MKSLLFNIGPVTIYWFGVMMALAFLTGLWNWTWLGKKEGKNAAFCSDLLFWIVISGILGARFAYITSDWSYFMQHPASIPRVDKGGLIYYGGFISAGIAVLIFSRLRKVPVLSMMDFVVTSLPLAHALGRVGCFMNGCCHGALYDGALAVAFPKFSLPWYAHFDAGLIKFTAALSRTVHPVQLYEAAFNVIIYAIVVAVHLRKRRHGMTLAAYLLLYPIGRFFVELLRGDERMPWLGPLSIAQGISIGVFVLGVAMLVVARMQPPHEKQSA